MSLFICISHTFLCEEESRKQLSLCLIFANLQIVRLSKLFHSFFLFSSSHSLSLSNLLTHWNRQSFKLFSLLHHQRNIPSGATFTLKWNTMPHVGLLAYGDEFITEPVPFELPNVEPGDAKGKIVPEKMWY